MCVNQILLMENVIFLAHKSINYSIFYLMTQSFYFTISTSVIHMHCVLNRLTSYIPIPKTRGVNLHVEGLAYKAFAKKKYNSEKKLSN